MGCTGKGMPNTTPVMILNRPENTRVAGRSIDPCSARAIMSGSSVPRSPRAPDISAAGLARSVRMLCRLRRPSSARNEFRILELIITQNKMWFMSQVSAALVVKKSKHGKYVLYI
jgi:hypothetical protein